MSAQEHPLLVALRAAQIRKRHASMDAPDAAHDPRAFHMWRDLGWLLDAYDEATSEIALLRCADPAKAGA